MESSNVKDAVGINKKRSFTDTNEMLKVKIRTFANFRESSSFFSQCDEKLFKEFSPKITVFKEEF